MKCEGNCTEDNGLHKGDVRTVIVTDKNRSFKFNYCEEAIEEDRRRGFTVTVIDDEKKHDEWISFENNHK
jgi:hypothetical protein